MFRIPFTIFFPLCRFSRFRSFWWVTKVHAWPPPWSPPKSLNGIRLIRDLPAFWLRAFYFTALHIYRKKGKGGGAKDLVASANAFLLLGCGTNQSIGMLILYEGLLKKISMVCIFSSDLKTWHSFHFFQVFLQLWLFDSFFKIFFKRFVHIKPSHTFLPLRGISLGLAWWPSPRTFWWWSAGIPCRGTCWPRAVPGPPEDNATPFLFYFAILNFVLILPFIDGKYSIFFIE